MEGRLDLPFSGDVGRQESSHHPRPRALFSCGLPDYGEHLRGSAAQDIGVVADKLAEVVIRTAARGGKIVVPAFAVGRTSNWSIS